LKNFVKRRGNRYEYLTRFLSPETSSHLQAALMDFTFYMSITSAPAKDLAALRVCLWFCKDKALGDEMQA